MIIKYPKIQTLYNRDETFKVNPLELRLHEFGLINEWMVTEKIDGTNIRVILTPEGNVEFRGRTDRAQTPEPLLCALAEMFPAEKLQNAFELDPNGIWPTVILFGEGYGHKIQKGGGNYNPKNSFRLFDVLVNRWWLNWDGVCDVAEKLEIKAVPYLGKIQTLPSRQEHLNFIVGFNSRVALEENETEIQPEGIVARTDPLLMCRNGQRLIWKLKYKDF